MGNKGKADCYKLAPFFIAIVLYFALVRQDTSVVWSTILKCLPIIALMLYVLLTGHNISKAYTRYILVGLIFSCGGDALLNVDLFPLGMVSFGMAHVFYIAAFGWYPRKWWIGLALYIPVVIFIVFIIKNLDEVLVVGVPIYCFILSTMLWRAIVRANTLRDRYAIFCSVGAFVFLISDALIGVTMFMDLNFAYARLFIMITYYAAQFAIALSTANDGSTSIEFKQNKQ